MLDEIKEKIKPRKNTLLKVKSELKEEFVGIDYIIDELFKFLEIWYIMPEVLTRPIIINLWGMTGTGKTDLIRRLVKKLEFQDRFTEIELNTSGSAFNYADSVASILSRRIKDPKETHILLFDEIQKFRSKDEKNEEIKNAKYQDFWELLSDGKLAKKDDLIYFKKNIKRQIYNLKKRNREDKKAEWDYWDIENIEDTLGMEIDDSQIENLKENDLLQMLYDIQYNQKKYEPVDYSKTLIIISGNLDEAYTMANMTDESEINADIFHNFTKKITILDIKKSLSKIFRAEQVTRFGNIHLIYRALSSQNYKDLIELRVKNIVKDAIQKFDIDIKIDQSILDLIYKNGVFPTQGVRPVFSTITDILETNLSIAIYESILQNRKGFVLRYDDKSNKIISTENKENFLEVKYEGKLDLVRKNNSIDTIANVSVHEAGHCVAYSVLFGLVPLQLKSKIASANSAGFTFTHSVKDTRSNLIKQIQILLAGSLAENLIFGLENTTSGGAGDIEVCTKIAFHYVCNHGFSQKFVGRYAHKKEESIDNKLINQEVEKLLKENKIKVKNLLINHKDYLIELAQKLSIKGSLTPKQIQKIAEKHGIKTLIKTEEWLVQENYNKMLASKNWLPATE